MTLDHFFAVASQFSQSGRVRDVRPYGSGNVHDTFLVTVEAAGLQRFILQRLNTRVFSEPELVMRNLRLCTAHVHRRLLGSGSEPGRRWEMPRVLPARDGRDYFVDRHGAFWRGLSYIEAAQTFDTISHLEQAREVGYGLGRFHRLLSDLDPEGLADPLPGFHVTPGYLRHYDQVRANYVGPDSPEVALCANSVAWRRDWAHVLERARERGRLSLRVIHGDPKVNNIMLDSTTGRAVAMVDLDTVKPGLVHYDIGDCLRSGCNPLGEETGRWQEVRFDPELCRAILRGYLSQARDFLTTADYDFLFDAIRLIAFELGLRFFTDYLAGDVYFKARRPGHNLVRALVQFRLTESIESQEKSLRLLIRDEIRDPAA